MRTVRSMQSADIDKVYQIESSAHRTPWSREILSDCVLVGYDCRILEQKKYGKKEMIGYIISRRHFNTYHILNFCISPSYHHQGFGKYLLDNVLNSLKENTIINTIVLEVRPTNLAAIALYEQFGFKRDAIKKDYYQDEQGSEDALLLKKILSAND